MVIFIHMIMVNLLKEIFGKNEPHGNIYTHDNGESFEGDIEKN